MFALTYYEKMSDVKRAVNFHKYIEDLNRTRYTSETSSHHEYGSSVDGRTGESAFCID